MSLILFSRLIIAGCKINKTLKLSTQPHGPVAQPISEEVWQRLAFYNLLAPTRG